MIVLKIPLTISLNGSLAKKCIYLISKGYSLIGLPCFVWVSVSNRIGLSQMGSSKFRQYSKYRCEIWALDTNAQSAGVLH